MPAALASAPMRLLLINSVLEWPSGLKVFEDTDTSADCLVIPYNEVSEEQWGRTMVLTWRWGKAKPMPSPITGFSPMSDDQWSELLELMRIGLESGMEYIWIGESVVSSPYALLMLDSESCFLLIDWSVVPQYLGDPMTEVLRSKLFYARSAVSEYLSPRSVTLYHPHSCPTLTQ